MEHPDLNFLITREILQDRIREGSRQRLLPNPISVSPIRRVTGQALIAIGSRIAARPRPISPRPGIGGVSIVGRLDG
jgi:hypothetical protein